MLHNKEIKTVFSQSQPILILLNSKKISSIRSDLANN